MSPGSRPPSAVRESVSGDDVEREPAVRRSRPTVRQTPATATESPTAAPRRSRVPRRRAASRRRRDRAELADDAGEHAAKVTARAGTPRRARLLRRARCAGGAARAAPRASPSKRGPSPASDGRDEEEQLVDEACGEERGRERRAALEQQRLDAFGGERAQLLLERPAAQLELRALRQRAAPEREPARLRRARRRRARRAAARRRAPFPSRPRPRRTRRAARARAGATPRPRPSGGPGR